MTFQPQGRPIAVNPPQTAITIAPPAYSGSPAWGYAIYFPRTTEDLQAQILGATSPGPRTTTTLEPGFVLYFPFSVADPARVTWPTLVSALNEVYPGIPFATTAPAFRFDVEDGPTSITTMVVSLNTSDTIYIPITALLATSIDMNPGVARLRSAALTTLPTAPASPTAGISSAGTSTPEIPTGGATTATSPPIISPTITAGPDHDNSRSFAATLAGGIVGGFLAAVLLCGSLGFFFIRRKRSQRSASATHDASEEGDKKATDKISGMTGAQKQEMDNTNPVIVEVAGGQSVMSFSDLLLAPEGGRTRWWHFNRKGGR